MFSRFDEIFASCGWRVVTLQYGKALEAAFARERRRGAAGPGSMRCPNADYAALTYLGGAAWRERLLKDGARRPSRSSTRATTTALAALMTNLGGHDMEALVEAFDAAQDDVPTLFIAFTIKGNRPALRRPQGQSCRADEPRPDRRSARGDGDRRGRGMGALGGPRRQQRRGGEGAGRRAAGSRATKRARPWNVAEVPPIAPPTGRRSNRPRPRSARSCSISPAPAARSPTGSSPPRPTSPSRPISAPG